MIPPANHETDESTCQPPNQPVVSCASFQVQSWAQQQGQRIQSGLAALQAEREEVQGLLDWISSAEEALLLREQEPPAETLEINMELIAQHLVRRGLNGSGNRTRGRMDR